MRTLLLLLTSPLWAQDLPVERLDKEAAPQGVSLNLDDKFSVQGGSVVNRVIMGSTTIHGDLVADSPTLVVDSANNRVGIGTASPSSGLHVATTIRFNDDTLLTNASGLVVQSTVASNGGTESYAGALGTFVDITALAITITPSRSTSLIRLRANVNITPATNGSAGIRVVRGSTAICLGTAASTRTNLSCNYPASQNVDSPPQSCAIECVDAPATTSATTYKIQVAIFFSATAYLNRSINDTDNSDHTRSLSTLHVEEILRP